jgi:DNA/RNA-binding domain of Phe-tRNA-synthetase-like protein
MLSIIIDPHIRVKCPRLILNALQCNVTFSLENEPLWLYIEEILVQIRNELTIEDISKIPPVRKAREAYKALGKDPSRYRLSAEALLRRILQGKSLYKVNNIIDILNVISVRSGISIGGYDLERIQGKIVLSVGNEDDLYYAIGRGQLNISGLPVLKDMVGPFGNPTSDSERTCVTNKTRNFLMVFFNFEGSGVIEEWLTESKGLLIQYAQGKDFIVTAYE